MVVIGRLRIEIERREISLRIQRTAHFERERRALGIPGRFLIPHPLNADRPADFLCEEGGFETRVIRRGSPVSLWTFHPNDANLLACGLTESRERILGQLSKGFRQRVALAACLLNDPQVLILDEPSVGLDPLQVAEMRKLIRELGRDRTILFSTHVLSEAESVCDRVVILDRGKLLAEGTPADLAARFVARALHVELLGDADRALAAVATLREATAELLSREPTVRLRVTLPAPPVAESRAALARALAKADAVVIGLESEKTSLEEVFARVTQEAAA